MSEWVEYPAMDRFWDLIVEHANEPSPIIKQSIMMKIRWLKFGMVMGLTR